MVQAEMGTNAIVVSMRDVPLGPMWNPWQKAGVEVVATLPESEAIATSISPQERARVRADTAVLRPSENGIGVEFVEERPEIEWEPASKKDPVKVPPPLKLKAVSRPPLEAAAVPVSVREEASNTVTNIPMESDRYIPPTLKKIQEQLTRQGVESSLVRNLRWPTRRPVKNLSSS
jgi:hypothetical protein